jgi:AcrR family transcriptional regulator
MTIDSVNDLADGAPEPDSYVPRTERRKPTRKRNSGKETRLKLLAAARATGAKTPFSRITVEAIAQATGVSRGTFYLYFESKEDIYLQLVQEACARLYVEASRAPGATGAKDSILSATRGYSEALRATEDVMKFLYTVAASEEQFGALLAGSRSRFYQRIARNLERGIASGIYRDVDIDATSRALGGMVEHFFVDAMLEGRAVPVDQSVELLADLWYCAIRADGSESRPALASS